MAELTVLKQKSVLYVEDDNMTRLELSKYLKRRFRVVHEAENGLKGLELYGKYNPDIVIADIEMPEMSGVLMAEKIMEINRNQPIIITTGYNDDAHKSPYACFTIIKPIDYKKLLDAINKCIVR